MTILNFGSLNVDHVYEVEHFVRPGETLSSRSYKQYSGGKGANQSIALAYAGAKVFHAGKLGKDGEWLKAKLARCGVDVSLIEVVEGPSGHAIIQVNRAGENAIVLHGGANHAITPKDALRVLSHFKAGDYLLLQNEITAIPEIMQRAAALGLKIVFNPAPMQPEVLKYPLKSVDTFILNEIEAAELTGELDEDKIPGALCALYPAATIVLTLGDRGARYYHGPERLHAPAHKVNVVDTTAAGDTFIGYYLAAVAGGKKPDAAMKLACKAAAICVTRPGAADSIPKRSEVDAFSG